MSENAWYTAITLCTVAAIVAGPLHIIIVYVNDMMDGTTLLLTSSSSLLTGAAMANLCWMTREK